MELCHDDWVTISFVAAHTEKLEAERTHWFDSAHSLLESLTKARVERDEWIARFNGMIRDVAHASRRADAAETKLEALDRANATLIAARDYAETQTTALVARVQELANEFRAESNRHYWYGRAAYEATILKSRRTSPHIARVEAEVGKTTLCLTRDDEVFEVLVMTELKRHHGVTKAVFSELPGDRTA